MTSTGAVDVKPHVRIVLVVEPDPVLRNNMARALARLPGIEVTTASSVRESRALIQSDPPALLVAELTLPDGCAIELLAEAPQAPAIAISENLDPHRDALSKLRHVQARSKPIALSTLSGLVRELTGPAPTSRAPLPFTAADYIQLACAGRYSVSLALHKNAQAIGQITIRDGEIWSASDAQGVGVQALQRLLFLAGSDVKLEAVGDAAPARNIEGTWQAVLLKTALAHDESLRAPPPSEQLAPTAPSQPRRARSSGRQAQTPAERSTGGTLVSLPRAGGGAARAAPRSGTGDAVGTGAAAPARGERRPPINTAYESLLERAVDAMLHRRLADAYDIFQQAAALRPDDTQVNTNLRRLTGMGFGAPMGTPGSTP